MARDAALYVCGLAGLERHAAALRPAGLVSLLPAREQPPTPAGVPRDAHLRLEIDDIEAPLPGFVAPEASHVRALIDFARAWDGERPLLIHCAAGISRSTAAALAVLCARSGEAEDALARRLRRAAPHASPNRRLIGLADAVMGRHGRLVAAVEAMGQAVLALEGPLVRLPVAGSDR